MADKSLNRTELVAAVAAESGQSQAAVNGVFDALFSTLAESVGNGTKVTIPGWLAVERTHRHVARNRPTLADRESLGDVGDFQQHQESLPSGGAVTQQRT
mgnify:CR=1 FL=1